MLLQILIILINWVYLYMSTDSVIRWFLAKTAEKFANCKNRHFASRHLICEVRFVFWTDLQTEGRTNTIGVIVMTSHWINYHKSLLQIWAKCDTSLLLIFTEYAGTLHIVQLIEEWQIFMFFHFTMVIQYDTVFVILNN